MSTAALTLAEIALLSIGCAVPLWRMLRHDPWADPPAPKVSTGDVPLATFDHGGLT